jgi:hypothetical protein
MGRRRGPALVYIDSAGTRHDIARTAIPDPVERDLCRALTTRADDLADKADDDDKPTRPPIGFTP